MRMPPLSHANTRRAMSLAGTNALSRPRHPAPPHSSPSPREGRVTPLACKQRAPGNERGVGDPLTPYYHLRSPTECEGLSSPTPLSHAAGTPPPSLARKRELV